MTQSHLGARAVRGATALALRTGLFTVLSVLRVALVARFLGPAELGLYGVLTLVAEAARALTTLGAAAVVIQRDELGERDLATYRSFAIFQASIAALIVVSVTPFSVDVSMRERALRLGLLVALAVLLPGISNPGRLVAEREARFERVSFLESVGAVTELVLVVGAAIWLRSAAALALGALSRAAVEVLLSYVLFPLGPRPAFHKEAAREYLRASGHFLAISAGAYVMIYGDNLVIANRLGTVALGLYVAAHRLTELAFSALAGVTNRVVFPVLSRLRHENARFSSSVAMLMELQVLYLAAVATPLVAFAPFWVSLFYGARFAPAAAVLQALFFVTVGRAFSRMVTPIMLAVGRYDFESKVKGIEAAVFVAGVLIGVKTAGLVGVALGAGAGYTVAAGLRLYFLHRSVGVPGLLLARMLGTGAALAIASLVVAFGVGRATSGLGRWSGWLEVASFGASFGLLTLCTRGPLLRSAWRLVRAGLRTRTTEVRVEAALPQNPV